ncbi:hypothetical protein ACI792_10005 [Blastococcus sp. SYSU DS0669]
MTGNMWLVGLGLGAAFGLAVAYGRFAPPLRPGVATAVIAVAVVGVPTAASALYRHVFLRRNVYGLVNLAGVFATTANAFLVGALGDPGVDGGWFVAPLVWALALTVAFDARTRRSHRLADMSAGDQISAIAFWLLSFLGVAQSQHLFREPGWESALTVFLCAVLFGWLTVLVCRTSLHFGFVVRRDMDEIVRARPRPLPRWGRWYAGRFQSTFTDPSTCFAVATSLVSGVLLVPTGSPWGRIAPFLAVAAVLLVPLWPFARARASARTATSS